jgi:hypothetical protein
MGGLRTRGEFFVFGFWFFLVRGPGLAPAGDLLFFASPKKRRQKKGDPTVCVPPLRCGQPAVLAFRGVSPKLASLKQGRALIRETLRSSAHTEGLGYRTGLCFARPPSHRGAARRGGWHWLLGLVLGPSEATARLLPPFCMRRGAQMEAGSGPQLFERNAVQRVLRTPAGIEHRRLPVAKRRDADSRVAFSLLTFFWRSKRK